MRSKTFHCLPVAPDRARRSRRRRHHHRRGSAKYLACSYKDSAGRSHTSRHARQQRASPRQWQARNPRRRRCGGGNRPTAGGGARLGGEDGGSRLKSASRMSTLENIEFFEEVARRVTHRDAFPIERRIILLNPLWKMRHGASRASRPFPKSLTGFGFTLGPFPTDGFQDGGDTPLIGGANPWGFEKQG